METPERKTFGVFILIKNVYKKINTFLLIDIFFNRGEL